MEIDLVKVKFLNKPDKIENALEELTKTHVIDKNLHEIKNEILTDYSAESEMVGRLKISDQTCETHI